MLSCNGHYRWTKEWLIGGGYREDQTSTKDEPYWLDPVSDKRYYKYHPTTNREQAFELAERIMEDSGNDIILKAGQNNMRLIVEDAIQYFTEKQNANV